jgi:hypothetical protein
MIKKYRYFFIVMSVLMPIQITATILNYYYVQKAIDDDDTSTSKL